MLRAYNHMTWRPIHFKPDSNHLVKWIETKRFQTALAQCAFSVNANQCALNRIECALSVQCEHALRNKAIYLKVANALVPFSTLDPFTAASSTSSALSSACFFSKRRAKLPVPQCHEHRHDNEIYVSFSPCHMTVT